MLFLSAALSLLSVLVRKERRQLVLTARDRRKKVRVAPRRIAASLAFATLFFAGAALSAGAGNGVVQLIDPASDSAAPADTTTTTTTTTTSFGYGGSHNGSERRIAGRSSSLRPSSLLPPSRSRRSWARRRRPRHQQRP